VVVEDSDADVIAASLQDPATFAVIFDRHAGVIHRFLLRRVEPAEADGLLGEVFRIAFERRSTFDPSRTCARPWLYGIAANVAAKYHRSESRRLRATARLAAQRSLAVDPAERAVPAVDARADWAVVADALAALPSPERQALLLFAWEELSYIEIATALGVPVGTVRSRINRGRARLAELTADTRRQQADSANPQKARS
jgi:RNA polymerase sigma-70 factor (ECF subfamily)